MIVDKIVSLTMAIGAIFGFFKDKNDPEKKIGRLHLKEYAITKKAVIKAHYAFQNLEKHNKAKTMKNKEHFDKRMKAYIKAFYNLITKE